MASFDYRIELWNGSTLSEILNSKAESCSWSFNRVGGCDECTLVLKASLSDYASIVCGSTWKIRIRIRFEGTSDYRYLYTGRILFKNRIAGSPEKIEFRAIGHVHQLQKVVISKNPTTGESAVYSGMEISEIVTDFLVDYIEPYTDISGHTITATSVVPESITFDTIAIDAIQLLGTLAGNCEWGIRGDEEFYFVPRSSTIGWDFFEGQPGVNYIENSEDGSDITNRIYFSGAEGLECILEAESDVTNIEQTVKNTTYIFGKSTTYQELIQTFTGISKIKTLSLSIGKTGFSNLVIDGDMETVGMANWLDYGPKAVLAEKRLYDAGGSDHYLWVNPKGSNSGKKQEIDSLSGEYLFSFKYKVRYKIYPMKLQIFNLTTNSQVFYKASYNSKSWLNQTISFEVGVDEDIEIRFIGVEFSIDNVKLEGTQDDVEISLVAAADPDTAIKTVTLSGSEISSSAQDFKFDFTIDNLIPATSYGFTMKRTGDLSDSSYYFIDGATSNLYSDGTLKYYDGTWHDLGKDAYFIISYSTSSATYDIKSERIKNASISNVEDAQLWATAYLSGKNLPIKTATLELVSKTHFFDYEPQINGAAIPLVSIRESSDSPSTKAQYFINQIQYSITDNGLAIHLELGTRQKKITDYLAWIQWQIDQLGMGNAGGNEGTTSPLMIGPSIPTQVTGLVIEDELMWEDSITGEVHSVVKATFNQNPASEFVDGYEIFWEEFNPD